MARSVFVLFLLFSATASAQPQPKFEDFTYWESISGPLRIEAGQLVTKNGGDRLLLKDGVLVKGGRLTIQADWIEILTKKRQVTMAGSVRIIEDTSVLLCDRLELDRRSSIAVMHRAVILVKTGVSADKLIACRTASGLAGAGFNAMTFEGDRLVREPEHYQVEGARFTACDCGDAAPSWEIRAARAEVLPGERAWLTWPVFYLKGIPVFVLPAAYLPLSERRTGLLFPQVNYSGRDGFVLSESLFVTLGGSADTTLSLDWFEERGFRERLEIRAVPGRRSRVEVRLAHIKDEKGEFGHRASGELHAWVRGSSGGSLRVAVRLFSDSDINRDFVSDMTGRATDAAPSAVVIEQRWPHAVLALDALYYQDLRFANVDLFSSEAHDTIQRLPAIWFHIAPVRLFDFPLELSLLAEVANLSSLSAAWRDWGVDGTPDEREPRYAGAPADRGGDNGPGGEGDGILGAGEIRRASRFLLHPELRLPLFFGQVLNLQARLGHRQVVYLPHGPRSPDPSSRGITFAGVNLGTELSRAYGARSGHTLAPWIRLAGAVLSSASGDPAVYLDVRDRLMTDAFQLQVGLDSGLYRSTGERGGFKRALHLRLMQAVDLAGDRLGQAAGWVRVAAHPAPNGTAHIAVTAGLRASYDWEAAKLAEVDASLGVRDRRGDSASITYLYMPAHRDAAGRPLPLSERTQREEGLLFGLDPLPLRALGETVHVIEGTGRLNVGRGLSLHAGASLDLREYELSWYGGGLAYRSDCRCWGFSLTVRMLRAQDFPDIFFLLDLAYLGAAGVGTNTRF
jgi:LPS-assembly protein